MLVEVGGKLFLGLFFCQVGQEGWRVSCLSPHLQKDPLLPLLPFTHCELCMLVLQSSSNPQELDLVSTFLWGHWIAFDWAFLLLLICGYAQFLMRQLSLCHLLFLWAATSYSFFFLLVCFFSLPAQPFRTPPIPLINLYECIHPPTHPSCCYLCNFMVILFHPPSTLLLCMGSSSWRMISLSRLYSVSCPQNTKFCQIHQISLWILWTFWAVLCSFSTRRCAMDGGGVPWMGPAACSQVHLI